MKQISTLLALGTLLLFTGFRIYAAADIEKISAVNSFSYSVGDTKPETPSSVTTNYYNADGILVMSLNSSGKTTYAYNESGLKTEAVSYYWSSETGTWVFSSKSTYEYDSEGYLSKENSVGEDGTIYSYISYENYVNGHPQDRKTMSGDGSTVTYWRHYNFTFENDLLVTEIESFISGEDTTILGKTNYTNTDGLVTSKAFMVYNNGTYSDSLSGAYTTNYTYNASNNLTSEETASISRWGSYVSVQDYIYETYNTDYAPENLQAVVKTGEGVPANTVELTWTASASSEVTGYKVICDTLISGLITGTSYTTTASAFNGKHEYAVVAIVDGTIRNISNMVSLTLLDEGVVPAENLKLLSISEANEDGSYDVKVTWDAPETTSVLKEYRVYYSDWSYAESTVDTVVVNIPSWYAVGYNTDGDTYGLEVNIYVVAAYTTGFSENSDTITCVPYDGPITEPDETGTNSLAVHGITVYPNPAASYICFPENVSASIYSLTGKKVKSISSVNRMDVSNLEKGMYLIRATNKEGKQFSTKISIIH